MFLKDMHDLMFVHNEKKNCDNWELALVINLHCLLGRTDARKNTRMNLACWYINAVGELPSILLSC